MLKKMHAVWKILRRLSGDDAYECYLVHRAHAHANETPLSRKEFFRREQERKWGGIRRCC